MKEVLAKVVKVSGEKTVRAVAYHKIPHKLYKKMINVKDTYLVHDENSSSKEGDEILIRFSRPISKLKRWSLVTVNKSGS